MNLYSELYLLSCELSYKVLQERDISWQEAVIYFTFALSLTEDYDNCSENLTMKMSLKSKVDQAFP